MVMPFATWAIEIIATALVGSIVGEYMAPSDGPLLGASAALGLLFCAHVLIRLRARRHF
jgi:hypothetical protein